MIRLSPLTLRSSHGLLLLLAVLGALLGVAAHTTSASAAGIAETRVGASDQISAARTGVASEVFSTATTGNTRCYDETSVGDLFATDATAGISVNIDSKIAGQMADRGWTPQSIQDIVGSHAEAHPVWDFTSGTAEPATAYANGSNAYVVVNDATGNVVQVSDTGAAGWKPVWQDPRFQR